jgi:lipid IVA palmitoyltransferase
MNHTLRTLLFLFLFCSNAHSQETCSSWPSLLKGACQRVHQVYTEGDTDLYVSGYAWHNRATYSSERVKTYNEAAWGGELGKGLYDEKGNWHGMFAIAFLDSHKNVEPAVGYSYLKTAHFGDDFKIGGGLALFVTARPDIFNNIPFPGLLPWAAITYKRATISATYIPGAKDAGNVLFIIGKWRF